MNGTVSEPVASAYSIPGGFCWNQQNENYVGGTELARLLRSAAVFSGGGSGMRAGCGILWAHFNRASPGCPPGDPGNPPIPK